MKHSCLSIYIDVSPALAEINLWSGRQSERMSLKHFFFGFLCGIFGAVIPQSEHIATQFALKKEERDRAHAMGSCFG